MSQVVCECGCIHFKKTYSHQRKVLNKEWCIKRTTEKDILTCRDCGKKQYFTIYENRLSYLMGTPEHIIKQYE